MTKGPISRSFGPIAGAFLVAHMCPVKLPKPLLAAGAVALFLGPVLGLGAVARYVIAEDIAARAAHDRVAAADLASRLLTSDLDDAESLLRHLAGEPGVRSALARGDGTRVAGFLAASLRAWPQYLSALGLDARGTQIAIVNADDLSAGTLTAFPAGATGSDRSTRDYFIGAVGSSAPFVSEAYRAGAPGSPVVVAVSLAVRDEAGLLGVLVLTVPPKDLISTLALTDDDTGREILVVDKRSHVVASTEPTREPLSEVVLPGVARALSGARATATVRLPQGERVVTYVPVGGAAWVLYVVDDPAVVLAVEREVASSVVVAGALAALVALLFAVIVIALFATLSRRTDELAHSRAALVQANADLTLANRHKSEFLSSVSHELRTPMNAIIGFSDLLDEQLRDTLTERQRRYFGNVREAGAHLLGLIDDVLDLSRVEADRIDLRPDIVGLADLLEPVMASARRSALDRGITWRAEIADTRVCVDIGRMRQVLYNLTSNALKFTPPGGSVGCRAVPAGPALVIDVSDSGIGIPADRRDRVFGMFERVNEDRSAAKGTGLGLALSKRLVEMHGGTITFESDENVGSTFRVRLPDAVVPGDRVDAREETHAALAR